MLINANAVYNLTVTSAIIGDGFIVNNGTFGQAASVTGVSVVATQLSSTATILASGGTLEFTGGDSFAGTLAGAGVIALSGSASFTLAAGLLVTVSTLEVTSNAGAAQVAILGTLLDYAGSFVQTSNTTLALAAKTTLELTGANDILNGTIVGAGGAFAPSLVQWGTSSTGSDNGLSLSGGVTLIDSGQIGQLGTVTIGALPGDVALLQITAGALLRSSGPVQRYTGDGNIVNNGTFEQECVRHRPQRGGEPT